MAVQWLRFCTSSVGGVNSIPHQRTKIPHTSWPQAPKKKKATQRKSGSGYPTVQSSKLQSEYLFWVTKGFYQLPMESVTSINKPTSFNLKTLGGLSWWLSGKECTCQHRKHGYNPQSRRISHATEQLSSCTTTIEPVLYNARTKSTGATCHNY